MNDAAIGEFFGVSNEPVERTDDKEYESKDVVPQLFDFLNSVTYDKSELIRGKVFAPSQLEKAYENVDFMVNRGLSMGIDTILYANEMNRLYELPADAQYRYYLHAVPKAKRRNKWAKAEKLDTLNLIAKHYGCNRNVARQFMKLLTEDDIALIVERHSTGGQSSKSKKKG